MPDNAAGPVTHDDILQELRAVQDRLKDGDARFGRIAEALEVLPAMQAELSSNTRETKRMGEVLDAWVTLKGAGNAVIWLGKVLSALAVIGATALAVIKYELWKGWS